MARGEGLRVRLSRVPGETPRGVLRRPLYLPAVIGNFGWTEEFQHTEYETVRQGQFSQPALGPSTARLLRTIDDMETLTLTWEAAWLVEDGLDPDEVYRVLHAIGRARRPVEMLASLKLDERPLLRTFITIRSITTQLRQGEPDTRYYTLRPKEWREAEGRRRGEGRGSKLPTKHKLTADDTLHSLSRRYYGGSPKYARDIARANGLTGVGVTTRITATRRFAVGQKIKIPKVKTRAD